MSVRINKKILSALLCTLASPAFCVIPSQVQNIPIGGGVQGINLITLVPSSNYTDIDFSIAAATMTTLFSFTVSNNYETAFYVTLEFTHGKFVHSGTLSTLTSRETLQSAEPGVVPFTDLQLLETPSQSGTLGTGLNRVISPINIYQDVVNTGTGYWNADMPGGIATLQSTPTMNYGVDLQGTWNAGANGLEGVYSETVTITIFGGDGILHS